MSDKLFFRDGYMSHEIESFSKHYRCNVKNDDTHRYMRDHPLTLNDIVSSVVNIGTIDNGVSIYMSNPSFCSLLNDHSRSELLHQFIHDYPGAMDMYEEWLTWHHLTKK